MVVIPEVAVTAGSASSPPALITTTITYQKYNDVCGTTDSSPVSSSLCNEYIENIMVFCFEIVYFRVVQRKKQEYYSRFFLLPSKMF